MNIGELVGCYILISGISRYSGIKAVLLPPFRYTGNCMNWFLLVYFLWVPIACGFIDFSRICYVIFCGVMWKYLNLSYIINTHLPVLFLLSAMFTFLPLVVVTTVAFDIGYFYYFILFLCTSAFFLSSYASFLIPFILFICTHVSSIG